MGLSPLTPDADASFDLVYSATDRDYGASSPHDLRDRSARARAGSPGKRQLRATWRLAEGDADATLEAGIGRAGPGRRKKAADETAEASAGDD
jgi:hypothetical protein